MTVFLNLRSTSVGGGPAAEVRVQASGPANEPRTVTALVEWIRGKNVLLATHGFNVNQRNGIESLSHWRERMTLPADWLYIGVLWPGDAWLPVVNYPFEGDDAMTSGKILANFLNRYFDEATSIAFASHSLGARVVLQTISSLDTNRVPVSRLVLMAGAIDNTCLTTEYKHAAAKVEAISVLASSRDKVLAFAFPVGNFLGGIVSRGHPYLRAALGRDGPAQANQPLLKDRWKIPNDWRYDHGDYLPGAGEDVQPLPLPVTLSPPQTTTPDDKPAWSAGFVSTRIRP